MFNWTGAEQLPELSLQNNQLASLPAHIFDPLLGLKILNLDHNQLTALEVSLFSKLTLLKFLDLKGNQISTLPVGLFAFQKELISLDLRKNLLSTLDIQVMTPMQSLKTLFISENPLDCDCGLQPVVIWSSNILENTDAKCRFPPQYQDRNWSVLTGVECTTPLPTVIITPSTDKTPGIDIHVPTSFTKKYTKVPSTSSTPPRSMRHDAFLYPISIILIVALAVLCLVLIATLVFIYWYKRLEA
jgi:hypothetical protein